MIFWRLSVRYKTTNDLKNEFKVIGSTCERYKFKIKPTHWFSEGYQFDIKQETTSTLDAIYKTTNFDTRGLIKAISNILRNNKYKMLLIR